jgi:glycosyltransferase involved in cell wall biosynthesis
MGRACVATDIGENRVDLDHGRAGVLAAPEPSALANAVRRLIANPSERITLGEAARQRALSSYAWPVLARQFVSALDLR